MSQKRNCLLILLLLMTCCFSCKRSHPPLVSFYYWKTRFGLDSSESSVLQANQVRPLYVRYFDITYNKIARKVQPTGLIQFPSGAIKQQIVPVVYIKNEVFTAIHTNAMDTLCRNVWLLCNQINNAIGQAPASIQFDCDWTVSTKDYYFYFLKKYKALSRQNISATIRLHQVKHALTTGIPPVDTGVLMFYNMGNIDAGNTNSIYDASIAASYLNKLKDYPLPLNIALPLFSWGIQIRDNQVVHLLNKMNASHFNKDSCFQQIRKDRFRAVHSCFKGGYYFLKNDEAKIEAITNDDLQSMASLINKYSKQDIHQIIFYDLDAFNLKNYETNTYQQIAHLFN